MQDKAGDMCMSIAKTLKGLTDVSGDELTRAKAMLKGNLFRQMDDDSALMQDMGTQLLLSGRYGASGSGRGGPDQMCLASPCKYGCGS